MSKVSLVEGKAPGLQRQALSPPSLMHSAKASTVQGAQQELKESLTTNVVKKKKKRKKFEGSSLLLNSWLLNIKFGLKGPTCNPSWSGSRLKASSRDPISKTLITKGMVEWLK
jgi:hypothetical protein